MRRRSFDRNGVFLPLPIFSAISAVFERVEVWLIDFDKCQIRQDSNWKNSNIARLKRSFEKEKRLHNIYWQLADWQILISAYNEAAMAN